MVDSTSSPAESQQSGASSTMGSVSSNGIERQSTGSTIPDPLSVEEYGRLFNAYREGKYLMPNDGDEQDRLDLQHHQWRLILDGRLYVAPIGEPADVLDIGTGTGIWAKQFAKQHPKSRVIGTDISLIQPQEALPPNLTFVREDSEELWVFDRTFDYIHWRLMFTCFNDFEAMIAKVLDNLNPGGWAEFHESQAELIPADEAAAEFLGNSTLQKSFDFINEAGHKMGRNFEAPKKFKRWMMEAGFEDVVERQILVPVNTWPLDRRDRMLGKWFSLNLLKFAGNLAKFLLLVGVPAEDIPGYQERFRLDVISPHMRVYTPKYIVYGRKPLRNGEARRTMSREDAGVKLEGLNLTPQPVHVQREGPAAAISAARGIKREATYEAGSAEWGLWSQPQAVVKSEPHVFTQASPSHSSAASPTEDLVGAKRKKAP